MERRQRLSGSAGSGDLAWLDGLGISPAASGEAALAELCERARASIASFVAPPDAAALGANVAPLEPAASVRRDVRALAPRLGEAEALRQLTRAAVATLRLALGEERAADLSLAAARAAGVELRPLASPLAVPVEAAASERVAAHALRAPCAACGLATYGAASLRLARAALGRGWAARALAEGLAEALPQDHGG